MSKTPVAVLISDVHFNINTIEVASKAVTLAIDKAVELNVDLIVSGDLHDTKAHIRGECVIAMQKTFSRRGLTIHVLRGNHDSLNEKSIEHSLNILPINCVVYATPKKFERNMLHSMGVGYPDCYMIPYYHDVNELKAYLQTVPPKSRLIMHQGIQGSNSGEYFQDKSALRPEDVAGFRVISGHYHTRQTIALPDGGSWDFVGNPFTLGFGEANDPPKGFQVLYNDGSLEFVPTNLRRHRVVELNVANGNGFDYNYSNPTDILWIKVVGPKLLVDLWPKNRIKEELKIIQDFKLELIPDEQTSNKTVEPVSQTKEEVLDGLIDSLTNTTVIQKQRLKAAWRDFV